MALSTLAWNAIVASSARTGEATAMPTRAARPIPALRRVIMKNPPSWDALLTYSGLRRQAVRILFLDFSGVDAAQVVYHLTGQFFPGGQDTIIEGIVVAVLDLAALLQPADGPAHACHPGNSLAEAQIVYRCGVIEDTGILEDVHADSGAA